MNKKCSNSINTRGSIWERIVSIYLISEKMPLSSILDLCRWVTLACLLPFVWRTHIKGVSLNKKLTSDWYNNESHHIACLNKKCDKIPSICDEQLLKKMRQMFVTNTQTGKDRVWHTMVKQLHVVYTTFSFGCKYIQKLSWLTCISKIWQFLLYTFHIFSFSHTDIF